MCPDVGNASCSPFFEDKSVAGDRACFKFNSYLKLVSTSSSEIHIDEFKLERQHTFEEKSFLPVDRKEPAA